MPKVLVVDDTEDDRCLIEGILESLGRLCLLSQFGAYLELVLLL